MTAVLVTARQLATKYKVSPKTIRKLAAQNILPVVRLSPACLRFNLADCDTLLAGSKHIKNSGRPRKVSSRRKRFSVTVNSINQKDRPHLQWMVNVQHPITGRKRLFFRTKEAAESEASARRIEYENYGLKASDLSQAQRLEALSAIEVLKPYNTTITKVVDEFIERHKGSMATVSEVADLYYQSRVHKGRSNRHLGGLRSTFQRFREVYGDRRMIVVTTVDIQDWLDGLEVGPQTTNNKRALLHCLFQFAMKRKVIRENPVHQIEKETVKAGKVGIFTSDQMRSLLKAAKDIPDVLATLVIGGFAGIRPEEIARLNWSAVNLEHGQIDCGSEITKTAKHRYVKIEPVLAAWLKEIPPGQGLIQKPNFRCRLDNVRRAAGFKARGIYVIKPGPEGEETATPEEIQTVEATLAEWPHDGLRHSYASYHLAHFKNAAETAIQLGHGGTSMLYQNYRHRVPETTAAAWWALFPSTEGQQ